MTLDRTKIASRWDQAPNCGFSSMCRFVTPARLESFEEPTYLNVRLSTREREELFLGSNEQFSQAPGNGKVQDATLRCFFFPFIGVMAGHWDYSGIAS